jgi:hypothetical protein
LPLVFSKELHVVIKNGYVSSRTHLCSKLAGNIKLVSVSDSGETDEVATIPYLVVLSKPTLPHMSKPINSTSRVVLTMDSEVFGKCQTLEWDPLAFEFSPTESVPRSPPVAKSRFSFRSRPKN